MRRSMIVQRSDGMKPMEEFEKLDLQKAEEALKEVIVKKKEWESFSEVQRLAFMLMRRFSTPSEMKQWQGEEVDFDNPWTCVGHKEWVTSAQLILDRLNFGNACYIIRIIRGG